MIRRHTQKGFTLVELAIVLTVIGLLIGGILKGQQLVQNSRVVATIAQVNAIEAATTTFRDTYNALPGDMMDGDQKIPGCTISCQNRMVSGTGNGGDGIVGQTNWFMGWLVQNGLVFSNTPIGGPQQETGLFWAELALAGLLKGIDGTAGINTTTPAFGVTYPTAAIGGGFIVGNSNYFSPISGPIAWLLQGRPCVGPGCTNSLFGMIGTVIALTADPTANPNALLGSFVFGNALQGRLLLTPAQAAQIDRKMDDGDPFSGSVEPYGLYTSCYNTNAATGGTPTGAYNEAVNSKDCGLFFRIQG